MFFYIYINMQSGGISVCIIVSYILWLVAVVRNLPWRNARSRTFWLES